MTKPDQTSTARRVYRYPINLVDEQTVTLPAGAEILHVARRDASDHLVDMWALVDLDAPPENRCIRVAGTGHPLSPAEGLAYLGTVQLYAGAFVFHVFEEAQ